MDPLDCIKRDLEDIVAAGSEAAEDPQFDLSDYSGGNFDDAFSTGLEVGQYRLAKDLLKIWPSA